MEIKKVPISSVKTWDKNPRNIKTEDYERLKRQIKKLGVYKPLVCFLEKGMYITLGGNMRLTALKDLGQKEVEVSIVEPKSEAEKVEFSLSDNDRAGEYDELALAELVYGVKDDIELGDFKVDLGLPLDIGSLLMEYGPGGEGGEGQAKDVLRQRFIVPPFSVLDARQGYWQERKRAWIDLGIQSDLGRHDNLLGMSGTAKISVHKGRAAIHGYPLDKDIHPCDKKKKKSAFEQEPLNRIMQQSGGEGLQTGTSIFDPVLCEILYRWFCPAGGSILDPFAGGSVRGVVAGKLGYKYKGIDLHEQQIKENERQAAEVFGDREDEKFIINPKKLTPIEKRGAYKVKRDDLFSTALARGGKARTALSLITEAKRRGAKGVITAGSRFSPQIAIAAKIASAQGMRCRIHIPTGGGTPEVIAAEKAGAEIKRHKPGYNSVIIARAKKDAMESGWTEIPFGMECEEAVRQTARQVGNIPEDTKRIVCAVGSGMSLCGILDGLKRRNLNIPILGVCVGADPGKRLGKYAPKDWGKTVTLEKAKLDYHSMVDSCELEGLKLDPIYEAKCIEFLQSGDLLWNVGIRGEGIEETKPKWIAGDSKKMDGLLPENEKYDFIFSCPPYFNLETYTDEPADLSNLTWTEFKNQYGVIIKKALSRLKNNRFACFVIGEIRNEKTGFYRKLVNLTSDEFTKEKGVNFYNEIILVTAIGSLPIRVGRQFSRNRKVGKTHQNILVFYKGEVAKIREEFPAIETDFPEEQAETPYGHYARIRNEGLNP